jgi:hypothetical protein
MQPVQTGRTRSRLVVQLLVSSPELLITGLNFVSPAVCFDFCKLGQDCTTKLQKVFFDKDQFSYYFRFKFSGYFDLCIYSSQAMKP